MSRGLSPFLVCAQNLAVYICRPGLPGHDCNNEHNRDPGKTAVTGMRHYIAGSLTTRYQHAIQVFTLGHG